LCEIRIVMAQNVSIPKGSRDFSPEIMQKREYIFNIIKQVFRVHGYQPLETPSMENLSTLLGKYGDEGDKLLFRILNSGDFLSSVPSDVLHEQPEYRKILPHISEKGLRYDLTVPFARFVVMNRNELQFPFKRYQIQPVWRADRPQKGRYREFYQCDVDVIGSRSMLNEFELILILDTIFARLNLKVSVHINNRKVLDGLLQKLHIENKLTDIAIAIDKLDKAGEKSVLEELESKGLSAEIGQQLLEIITLKGAPEKVLSDLHKLIGHTPAGAEGIGELEELWEYMRHADIETEVVFDLSLARGLDYYTGAIFEVKAQHVSMGSICGGGRYDNLTTFFGLPDMSGVGISFGADRIYDVMSELNLFPSDIQTSTRVIFLNFGNKSISYIFPLIKNLRDQGIACELFPDEEKIKKQMNYANKKNIPYVVIAGDDEIASGTFTLKNMTSGEQQKTDAETIIKILSKN
jgi:histidyl-tRNA synthetase